MCILFYRVWALMEKDGQAFHIDSIVFSQHLSRLFIERECRQDLRFGI